METDLPTELSKAFREIERLRASEGKWRNAWSALHKIYADDTERLRAALKQIADEEYVNAPEATFIARKALNEQKTRDLTSEEEMKLNQALYHSSKPV